MYVNKTLWLAYTYSMPPILSLPLFMACDDSDGCVTIAMAKDEIYVECGRIYVGWCCCDGAALVRLLPWLAYSQNRLNSKESVLYLEEEEELMRLREILSGGGYIRGGGVNNRDGGNGGAGVRFSGRCRGQMGGTPRDVGDSQQ
ncbi:hypothetical protein Tco_1123392, partial [Tanacetum coccineum]